MWSNPRWSLIVTSALFAMAFYVLPALVSKISSQQQLLKQNESLTLNHMSLLQMPNMVREGNAHNVHREMCIIKAFNVSNYNHVLLFATAYLPTKISHKVILRIVMYFFLNAFVQPFIFNNCLSSDLCSICCCYWIWGTLRNGEFI